MNYRTGIGFDAVRHELGGMRPDAPDGGMAEPTMLLGSSGMCDTRFKWYQALGHYKDTPICAIDMLWPPIDANLEEIRPYWVRYFKEQYKELIAFMERQTGRKMDYDRLRFRILKR